MKILKASADEIVKVVAMAVLLVCVTAALWAGNYGGAYNSGYGMPEGEQADDMYEIRDSRTGFWLVGGGAMVNRMPLALSEYVLPMGYFAYENIHKKVFGQVDFAWSIGFYDMMPEAEAAVVIPVKPFDVRISVGAYYDFIIGNHAGMLLKTGLVLNKYVGLDVLFIPFGTQPTVSYSESIKQGKIVENDGEHGLEFPVFGALITFRL